MEGRITTTEEGRGGGAVVEQIGTEMERCISTKSQKKFSLLGMKPTNKKYRNLKKNRPENLCYIHISWGGGGGGGAKKQTKGGGQRGPAPPPQKKKIPSPKIRWKVSRLNIFGSRRHLLHWLSSKGPNYQREVLVIPAGATEGHFEGKTPREVHQGDRVLARQCPGSPGTCNSEETGLPGLPMS